MNESKFYVLWRESDNDMIHCIEFNTLAEAEVFCLAPAILMPIVMKGEIISGAFEECYYEKSLNENEAPLR